MFPFFRTFLVIKLLIIWTITWIAKRSFNTWSHSYFSRKRLLHWLDFRLPIFRSDPRLIHSFVFSRSKTCNSSVCRLFTLGTQAYLEPVDSWLRFTTDLATEDSRAILEFESFSHTIIPLTKIFLNLIFQILIFLFISANSASRENRANHNSSYK